MPARPPRDHGCRSGVAQSQDAVDQRAIFEQHEIDPGSSRTTSPGTPIAGANRQNGRLMTSVYQLWILSSGRCSGTSVVALCWDFWSGTT